ncbi:MAG: hypothetical protein IPM16_21235 [Chloroflexi bacterium]|nr:hypothetical protein [Chloroflexota bacterium]
MFKAVLVLAVASVFLLTGCRRGEITIDPQSRSVSVTLQESDINDVIAEALAAQSNPLLRNPSVDLQPGLIVVNGEHVRRDGSGATVSGSISFRPTVTNNRLEITVESVAIDGLPNADDALMDFATKLADKLNARLQRTVRVFEVTSITVTDTSLSFVLQRGD